MAGVGIIITIIFLCVFFFLLSILDSFKLNKLRKRWEIQKNDDNKYKGESPGRISSITKAEPPTAGATVAYQRELLQATEAIPTGETNLSNGKDTNLTRGFLKRFRK